MGWRGWSWHLLQGGPVCSLSKSDVSGWHLTLAVLRVLWPAGGMGIHPSVGVSVLAQELSSVPDQQGSGRACLTCSSQFPLLQNGRSEELHITEWQRDSVERKALAWAEGQ